MQVRLKGKLFADGKDLKLSQLPVTARNGLAPQVFAPSIDDFRQALLRLSKTYSEIFVLLISSQLNPAIDHAHTASTTVSLPARVDVIDSQTTSVGLGLLVQAAAEAARNGVQAAEIHRMLRLLIPHIYTLFCVQSLSYLAHSGLMDPDQATIGEMLGMMPFLSLENGRLTPLQKARSTRHLVDIFQEFIGEFSRLKHVALLQGMPSMAHEARIIRERILESIPPSPFSEHVLGGALASILGPRCIGLVVMENFRGRDL